MGIYDRQYYRDDESQGFSLQSLTRGRSMVTILIGINVAVFILDALFPGASPLVAGGSPEPGRASQFLMLYAMDATSPWYWWRFLTYGFAHGGPGHIFGNMISLFFFGRAAEALYGSRKFLWMYLTAILAGSVIWMLAARLTGSGVNSALLGASGGVAAVVILFCLNFPKQKVYLLFLPFVGIPAWLLGVLFVGGDLMGAFGVHHRSNVAFIVHLVGAAYAYFFMRTSWELSQIIPGAASGHFSVPNPFKSKPKLKVHNPRQDNRHDQLASKADEILKKLHQQGEASLTARERKILEDYSRSIKQKHK